MNNLIQLASGNNPEIKQELNQFTQEYICKYQSFADIYNYAQKYSVDRQHLKSAILKNFAYVLNSGNLLKYQSRVDDITGLKTWVLAQKETAHSNTYAGTIQIYDSGTGEQVYKIPATKSKPGQHYTMGQYISYIMNTHAYADTTFEMYGPQTPNPATGNRLNLFRGLLHEPRDKALTESEIAEIEPYLRHLREVWADNNPDNYNSLLKWFAHIAQRTDNLTTIAVILYSREGAGKTSFQQWLMRYVFGQNYCTTIDNPARDMFGTSNKTVSQKCFVVIDEAKSGGALTRHIEQFKPMISNDTLQTRELYSDACRQNNYVNFMINTNNNNIVAMDDGSRRFRIYECSNARCGDTEYWNHFSKMCGIQESSEFPADKLLRLGGLFYNYLCYNVDLTGWNPAMMTETEALRQAKRAGINPAVKYLANIVSDFDIMEHVFSHYVVRNENTEMLDKIRSHNVCHEDMALDPEWKFEFIIPKLFDAYKATCRNNGDRPEINEADFKLVLQKVFRGLDKKYSNSKTIYITTIGNIRSRILKYCHEDTSWQEFIQKI